MPAGHDQFIATCGLLAGGVINATRSGSSSYAQTAKAVTDQLVGNLPATGVPRTVTDFRSAEGTT